MNVNYKFFNFSSVKTELKYFKHSETKLIHFNNFCDEKISFEKVFLEINKVINDLILKIEKEDNQHRVIASKTKSLLDSNDVLDTNSSLERVFKVLLSYGYKREYARDIILDGYYNDTTKKDIYTSTKIVVCKIPLKNIYKNSIRVYGFFKDGFFYPLFLDLNHCLMNKTSKEEQFFKKDKIIFINSLISNIK